MRFRVLFCLVYLLLFLPALAQSGAVRQLSAANVAAYVNGLRVEALVQYSPAQLILLNDKLAEQNRTTEMQAVLDRLEKTADWTVKPIVALEQIKGYLKSPNPVDLADLLQTLSRSGKAIPDEESIFHTLRENIDSDAERRAGYQLLQHFLTLYRGWQADPELIRWMLGIVPQEAPEYNHLILWLWAASNREDFPGLFTSFISAVRDNPQSYADIVAAHFSAQYRFKNWTYVIAEAPHYLRLLKQGGEAMLSVRDAWMNSYFRKRRFSDLITILDHPKQARELSLSSEETRHLLFRLWLKKGYLQQVQEQLEHLAALNAASLGVRYFEVGEFYFHRNRFRDSLPFYQRVKRVNSPESLIPLVQWRKFWAYYKLQDSQGMRRIIDWSRKYDFESREVAAKFCYWGIKLKLIEGRRMLSCYQEYPLTYYGFRSLSKAGRYSGIDRTMTAEKGAGSAPRKPTRQESRFLDVIHVLYLTGRKTLADHLVMRFAQQGMDEAFFSHLASVLAGAERYYLQQLLIELFFDESVVKNDDIHHPLLTVYYPVGYHGEVGRHSGDDRLPQMLAFAVIREESNFRPEVTSPAGAVGLMQLMPSTARYVAKLIRTQYQPEWLTRPDFNVKLGAAYLKRLLRRYKGNLFYTLAAYNGGPTNVKRWRKKAGDTDLDVFVETISYLETQNYVKRVIRSYTIYRMLYGSKVDAGDPGASADRRMHPKPSREESS